MDVDDEANGELATRITVGFMEEMQVSRVSPATALLAAMNSAALLTTNMGIPDILAVKLFRDLLKGRHRNK